MYDPNITGNRQWQNNLSTDLDQFRVKITDPFKSLLTINFGRHRWRIDGNICKYLMMQNMDIKGSLLVQTVIDHQPLFDSKNFNLDNLGFEISIQDYGLPGDSFSPGFGSIWC